ncbi:MAG: VIT1/CCC1 family protein [Salinibacterium sp.]|nr:VIT1/CCC1 family protein [Salinibacterium sp.]
MTVPASPPPTDSGAPAPTRAQKRRWRKYLADERAEAAIYRDLAARRTGEEREILLALAEAERRHEQHWIDLLGSAVTGIDQPGTDAAAPARLAPRTRLLGWFARRFGSVFVLALAQRSEARSPYAADGDASDRMAADERIHGEVIRGLATRGRLRLAGSFRAAVFGANDGLVSNLALVIGISATGLPATTVLFTGIAGLLAGALSMAAGEYVSVRSQLELLEASQPDPKSQSVLANLDVDANELALVYRARGMAADAADAQAAEVLGAVHLDPVDADGSQRAADPPETHHAVGGAMAPAVSSFCFFASGALIPVLPYLFGASGTLAVVIASTLVGLALLATGAIVGLLSGASPLKRALRQLAIGFGAAAATYLLGLTFGATALG